MKVYAVWIYNYEDSNVLKVFSTIEKAEKYMKDEGYTEDDNSYVSFGIEEYEVN